MNFDNVDIEVVEVDIKNESKYDITSLQPKMQRFIHLYITGEYTLQKLADLLQVHPNTLSNWLKREDVKGIINEMQEVTHDIVGIQLKALSTKAATKLSNLMDSPLDAVALQAVKDVLDRSGHKAKQEIKVDKTVITFEQKLNQLIDNVIDVEDYEIGDVND